MTLAGLLLGLVMPDQYQLPEAAANDDKIIAPQSCVPVDSNNSIDAVDTSIFINRVERETAGSLICPLIRDDPDGTLDTVLVTIQNVLKGATVGTTECCVYSFDTQGVEVDSVCVNADETDTLQTIRIEDVGSDDNGYYVLTCDFAQANEALYRIRTSEGP